MKIIKLEILDQCVYNEEIVEKNIIDLENGKILVSKLDEEKTDDCFTFALVDDNYREFYDRNYNGIFYAFYKKGDLWLLLQ